MMIINRSSTQLGGLQPKAVVTLASILPSFPLFHTERSRRHPLGDYNISVSKVVNNMQIVLKELFALPNSIPQDISQYKGNDLLMEAQGNLLRSLDEHAEACESVLRAFFPKNSNFNGNPHIQTYKDATKAYFEPIRKIVNHLKHSQGLVRELIVFSDTGTFIPAYYIEGVDENGHPGPEPTIHNSQNEAYSFHRDLKYHLYHLYAVSEALSDAIVEFLGDENLRPPEAINGTDDPLGTIAYGISLIPNLFLPHEQQLDYPSVRTSHCDGMVELTLSFPHIPQPIPSFRIKFCWQVWLGDGISQTFRLVYPPSDPPTMRQDGKSAAS